MTFLTFQQEIELAVKKKVQLKINDNHTTMLSVKWEPECTKISIHRIFLEAPKNIMDALSCYIKKKNGHLCPSVQAYIEEKLQNEDYSYRIPPEKLISQGVCYDLKQFYDEINLEYFEGKVNLAITWFGRATKKNRSRVTFGMYQHSLKLIKIHKLLDNPFFPEYFVKFVIYHEMVHHVRPAYYDTKGKHHIHSKEFKELESQYIHFAAAKAWMKKHYDNFFMM